jgi:type 1 glutamine amidotransferase
MKELATRHFFDLTVWEDPKGFTDKFLSQFQVVVFLNTTGNIFDSSQQGVLERFIRSGKGFVGIHSASDTEYDWTWYTQLVGRMFKTHPPVQTARLVVTDSTFPGLKGFTDGKLWTDEYYEFGPEKVSGLNYILSVDESTYSPKAGSDAHMHPLAWYHSFDGGRSFYTALGHLPAIYSDAAFLDHVYAGILWAATGRGKRID